MEYYNPSSWNELDAGNDNLFSFLSRNMNQQQPTLTIDPTRFPAPAVDNPTPPASEDSSPSPPSIKEREHFNQQQRYSTRNYSPLDEDSSKRKADDLSDSDDSTYDTQPQSKQQHRSDSHANTARRPSGAASGAQKKKTGGPDENRALKRKERHVKELEDQVAELEAKTNTQERENENLRDLLGRLQNENLLLKQSAFTFSVPNGRSNPSSLSQQQPPANTRSDSSPKLSSASSSSSASSPENVTSSDFPPQSTLFARPSTGRGYASTSSVSTASSSATDASPRSTVASSRFLSSPGAFGLGTQADFPNTFDFGFNTAPGDVNIAALDSKKTGNGITTIASNPAFMSFGDSVNDPMAWASFGPADYIATPSSQIPTSTDASSLDINGLFGLSSSSSYPGLGMSSSNFNSVDDLFSTTTGTGVTPAFLGDSGSTHNQSSSSFVMPSPPTTTESPDSMTQHDDGGCPKTAADFQTLRQNMTPSTFGPPVSRPSPPAIHATSVTAASSPASEEERDHACAHAKMAALCADLPRTTKKPNQIEIGRAWEKLRQTKGFEECDIDQLCSDLSAKARCDGSRPVLEESSFNDIVSGLGKVYKR